MHPSSTNFSPFPEHPLPAYFTEQRRPSMPHSAATIEKNTLSMLLTGHALSPWKSSDSISSSPSSPSDNKYPQRISTGPVLINERRRKSDNKRLSVITSKDTTPASHTLSHQQSHHHRGGANQSETSSGHSIATGIRESFFPRPPQTPTTPRMSTLFTSEVVMTNTINKDYDPTTGNKIINKYMIIKEIGRGVHGKVKLAEDIETGEQVAIKIVDKRNRRRQLGYSLLRGNSQQHVRGSDQLRKVGDLPQYRENDQKIRREIAILKKCAHPHVVKLREVIDDPASRKVYLALEYMEGGEIQWRDENDMPVLSLDQARNVFRDVVSGLDYLHYQGIIHRDIKPANLLLTKDSVVKISDFGVSYFNEMLAGDDAVVAAHRMADDSGRIDRELAETAGTPAFFAPELCCAGDAPLSPTIETPEGGKSHPSGRPRPHRPRITKAIDVWALGVTLYCFVFGRCPFTASTEFELFDTIPTEPLSFPAAEDIGFEIPDNLRDLLIRLLTKNPEERITLEEVKHHPWVIEDLKDPANWWQESDPRYYKTVEVTDDEVTHAVTIMGRLRKSIQRFSSSLSNLTHGLTRRRSKTISQTSLPHQSAQHEPLQPTMPAPSHHESPITLPHSPTLGQHPSFSSMHLNEQSDDTDKRESQARGMPFQQRPISYLSDDTTYSTYTGSCSEPERPQEECHDPSDQSGEESRPSLARQVSSASSSSGMGIMIRRYRGGLMPLTKT